MPVDDECTTERDALEKKWAEAEELCSQALDAFTDWVEGLAETAEECAHDLGEPPDFGDTALDPMLLHELERQLEEYHAKVAECLLNSPVIDDWNLAVDLLAACDIAHEEAAALQDEHEACLHALHEGIPFA